MRAAAARRPRPARLDSAHLDAVALRDRRHLAQPRDLRAGASWKWRWRAASGSRWSNRTAQSQRPRSALRAARMPRRRGPTSSASTLAPRPQRRRRAPAPDRARPPRRTAPMAAVEVAAGLIARARAACRRRADQPHPLKWEFRAASASRTRLSRRASAARNPRGLGIEAEPAPPYGAPSIRIPAARPWH